MAISKGVFGRRIVSERGGVRRESAKLRGVLAGGLAAATIDVGAACVISGHPAEFILQTVAGGLLGKASFAGGVQTTLLGLILQELMGILIATVYALAASVAPTLARRWILGGLTYGVVIFAVMNYVVVPVSAWHVVPHFTPLSFVENTLAMLLFGLIVAFFARGTTRLR